MPSKQEIEAVETKIREFIMNIEAGTTNFKDGLPIAAKAALEAAEKVRNSPPEGEINELVRIFCTTSMYS